MSNKSDFSDALKPAAPDGATIIGYERERSTIPVDELARYLLSEQFLRRQEKVLSEILKEPIFKKSNQANLSRPDRYKLGLARGKKGRQLKNKLNWDEEDHAIAVYLHDDISPYSLHLVMFITTVREQASEAQRAYWMPLIESWNIIGAYAQTELGHGSNVRGLELEARWDPRTKDFILHSPHLTASKWWNGTMGRTATHAIVVAQLMLPASGSGEYQSHGPHPFIVQIREKGTHQPPESIIIGDIGPKIGYESMDNGYMLFNNHRVPYDAMLSRYSKVDPDTGKYTKPENSKVVYGSLTHVRANIVMDARLMLARAVTVAVRYLSIRRQFKDRDMESNVALETPVLDYPTVQIRILPLLATLFALHYSGKAMGELYSRTRKNIEEHGDFETLAELHSTSSGLKSLATEVTADGMETCRRALGGHGFSNASGLTQLKNNYLSKVTVEGDNWMITQQVARYLIKKVGELSSSANKPATTRTEESLKRYLSASQKTLNLNIYESDKAILEAFEWRAAHLAVKAHHQREIQKKPYNSLLIEFHKLSRASSQSILVINFYQALHSAETASLSPATQHVLHLLFRLFALTTMDAEGREFSTSGAVSNADLDVISDRVLELMGEIRPHAVRLVDAWKIPDYLLDSALGRYDGRVYEDLFHRAHRENPLNRETFNPDYRSDEVVLRSGDAGSMLSKL